jgi:deazaflavin-dependent oxidoreductase (nitroreductase family)
MPSLLRALGTGPAGREPDRSRARAAKRAVMRRLTNRGANRLVRPLSERGLLDRFWPVLETRGRRSGLPRRTPVGNGLRGDIFWIVTEHGWHADYVKNIEADPRVRVKVDGRWRTGTAHLLPDEDPYAKLRELGRPVNDSLLLTVGTEQLVVRVDLDPA